MNPFAHGWYAVLFMCFVPSKLLNSKSEYWSELNATIDGDKIEYSESDIQSFNITFETVVVDVSCNTIAVGQWENLPTMAKLYE